MNTQHEPIPVAEPRTFRSYGGAWVLDSAIVATQRTVAGKTRIHLASGASIDIPDERITPEVVVRAIITQPEGADQ